MFLWRVSLIALLLLSTAPAPLLRAQSEEQINSDEVKRVGQKLTCQCGSCKDNLNCQMSSGQCGFCKPSRTRIYKMQRAGMADSTILAAFIKEYGPDILRKDPGSAFWAVPYICLGLGGLAIVWYVRRKSAHPVVHGVGEMDPQLARYQDQIEKDMAKLD